MQSTLQRIKNLSSSQVAEVTKELFNIVYTQVPYTDVRRNAEGVVEAVQLLSLNTESLNQEISEIESTRFGRLILEAYVGEADLTSFVRQALDEVQRSDDLMVETLLALGIVVNLTLLVATTSLKVKKDANGKTTWEIIKKTASPKLIEAVVKPLTKTTMSGIE